MSIAKDHAEEFVASYAAAKRAQGLTGNDLNQRLQDLFEKAIEKGIEIGARAAHKQRRESPDDRH